MAAMMEWHLKSPDRLELLDGVQWQGNENSWTSFSARASPTWDDTLQSTPPQSPLCQAPRRPSNAGQRAIALSLCFSDNWCPEEELDSAALKAPALDCECAAKPASARALLSQMNREVAKAVAGTIAEKLLEAECAYERGLKRQRQPLVRAQLSAQVVP